MDPASFSQKLYKILDEQEQLRLESLANGTPADFASYKELVGEIRGFSLAKDELKTLLKDYTDDDDEDFGP